MSIPFLLYYCINMHVYIETKLILIQAEYYHFLLFIWGCLVYFFKWWLIVKTSFYPRFNSKFYQTEILPPPQKKRIKEKKKLNYIVYKILRLTKSKDWYELHDHTITKQTNMHLSLMILYTPSLIASVIEKRNIYMCVHVCIIR